MRLIAHNPAQKALTKEKSMPSVAKVQLIGHAGKDAELYDAKDGSKFARFSVAVTNKKGGEESTTWFNVTAFGKTAEIVVDRVKKGALVFVDGSVNLREYTTKEGEVRTSLDVAANQVLTLEKREGNQAGDSIEEEAKAALGKLGAKKTSKVVL